VIRSVAIASALILGLGAVITVAGGCDLLAGCPVITPSALPDGQPPGNPTLDVHSDKVAIWGSGPDRVELDIGLNLFVDYTDQMRGDVVIRGRPGMLFLHNDGSVTRPAITWTERGCDYTLSLDSSVSTDSARAYAARY
jgi:hypothetical protein